MLRRLGRGARRPFGCEQERVLDRDRRLRRQHLDRRQPPGREVPERRSIFQVEQAQHLALLEDRQTQCRARCDAVEVGSATGLLATRSSMMTRSWVSST